MLLNYFFKSILLVSGRKCSLPFYLTGSGQKDKKRVRLLKVWSTVTPVRPFHRFWVWLLFHFRATWVIIYHNLSCLPKEFQPRSPNTPQFTYVMNSGWKWFILHNLPNVFMHNFQYCFSYTIKNHVSFIKESIATCKCPSLWRLNPTLCLGFCKV